VWSPRRSACGDFGHSSYWLDEASPSSWRWIPGRYSWRTIRTTEANMAAYYLALRAWVRLGDKRDDRPAPVVRGRYAHRSRALRGRRASLRTTAGLTAALLLTGTPGRLWASQEARSYALRHVPDHCVLVVAPARCRCAHGCQGVEVMDRLRGRGSTRGLCHTSTLRLVLLAPSRCCPLVAGSPLPYPKAARGAHFPSRRIGVYGCVARAALAARALLLRAAPQHRLIAAAHQDPLAGILRPSSIPRPHGVWPR